MLFVRGALSLEGWGLSNSKLNLGFGLTCLSQTRLYQTLEKNTSYNEYVKFENGKKIYYDLNGNEFEPSMFDPQDHKKKTLSTKPRRKPIYRGPEHQTVVRNKDKTPSRDNLALRPLAPKMRKSKIRGEVIPIPIIKPGPFRYQKVEPTDVPRQFGVDILGFLNKRAVSRAHDEKYIPDFRSGCILRIKHTESAVSDKLVTFVGFCLGVYRKGIGTSVLLRNTIEGVAVEKRIPIYSPSVKSVEVLRFQRGRASKMYHVRKDDLASTTYNMKMKGDFEKTPQEIERHNHLAEKYEHLRRENINTTVLRQMRNDIVRAVRPEIMNRAARLFPLPAPKELSRSLRLRLRAVRMRALVARKRAARRELQKRRPGQTSRMKRKIARIVATEHAVKRYREKMLNPIKGLSETVGWEAPRVSPEMISKLRFTKLSSRQVSEICKNIKKTGMPAVKAIDLFQKEEGQRIKDSLSKDGWKVKGILQE